ncbi:MAG: histidine phosphatase family protein, partial [Myxococcota bacterium]
LQGDFDTSGVESWSEFLERLEEALTTMTLVEDGSGESVLAFTSAGTIAGMAGVLLGAGDVQTLELSWTMINASVSRATPDKVLH